MQQGILAGYFQPLDYTTAPSGQNVTTLEHVFITPNQSVTTSLYIPFRHFASALRNRTGLGGDLYENYGVLHFCVMAPLQTITSPTTVDVTIYSKFHSDFYLPSAAAQSRVKSLPPIHPVSLQEVHREMCNNGVDNAFNKLLTQRYSERNTFDQRHGAVLRELLLSKRLVLVAEGNSTSMTYNIKDVAGNVPIQNNATSSNTTKSKAHLNLDNPPLGGGGVPTFGQYSSMSKICSVEPTIVMGEHPCMLCRQPDAFRQVKETLVSDILSRRGYLKTVNMNTQATGTRFTDININSIMSDNGATIPWTYPANLEPLLKCLRWRGDVVIDIVAAKTAFHSFRLLAVLGYGQTAVVSGTENSFITQVLDFNNETSWASVKMPFNNRYEYCRAFEGRPPLLADVTEYGLGTLAFTVANELRAANNVAATVDVMFFVRMENVEIVGMAPYNTTDYTGDGARVVQIVTESAVDSFEPSLVDNDEGDAAETDVTPVDNTEISNRLPEQVNRLDIGDKFEYKIRDVVEFGRRHQKILPRNLRENAYRYSSTATTIGQSFIFDCIPVTSWGRIYAGWSGTIKYRLFLNYDVPTEAGFDFQPAVFIIPGPTNGTNSSNVNIDFYDGPGQNDTFSSVASISTWDFTPPVTDIVMQAGTYRQTPVEKLWQIQNSRAFIDISVPFYSEHNFLPLRDSYALNNWINARIVINAPIISGRAPTLEVYQAWGDDFRFHCWSPYSLLRYRPLRVTSGTAAPSGTVIGNYVVT